MLKGKPLVLDGGLGMLLESLAPEHDFLVKNDPLWSGRALIQAPDLIKNVHRVFLDAGCDIVTTSTYQISYDSLKRYTDFSDEAIEELWTNAVDICSETIRECGSNAKLCGSLGPFGAYLANYAEYTGEYGDTSNEKLERFHLPLSMFLTLNAKVDILAYETVPNYKELKVILNLLTKLSARGILKPFYIGMSFRNPSMMSDGTPLETVMAYLNQKITLHPQLKRHLYAIGCNCTKLEETSKILQNINKSNPHRFPTIVYPNFFGKEKGTKLDEAWLELVDECIKEGASIIGGCCGSGPDQIALIRRQVDKVFAS